MAKKASTRKISRREDRRMGNACVDCACVECRASDRGIKRRELFIEIVEDIAVLIDAASRKARQLNRKYPGSKLTWRDLAILPLDRPDSAV